MQSALSKTDLAPRPRTIGCTNMAFATTHPACGLTAAPQLKSLFSQRHVSYAPVIANRNPYQLTTVRRESTRVFNANHNAVTTVTTTNPPAQTEEKLPEPESKNVTPIAQNETPSVNQPAEAASEAPKEEDKPRGFLGKLKHALFGGKIDKQKLAAYGFGAFCAYGVISNINACRYHHGHGPAACLHGAWQAHDEMR